jgi:hypothetical protein
MDFCENDIDMDMKFLALDGKKKGKGVYDGQEYIAKCGVQLHPHRSWVSGAGAASPCPLLLLLFAAVVVIREGKGRRSLIVAL